MGLRNSDATITGPITGTGTTFTFRDPGIPGISTTNPSANYVLTVAGGIGNADGGAARNVVINRNMVMAAAST